MRRWSLLLALFVAAVPTALSAAPSVGFAAASDARDAALSGAQRRRVRAVLAATRGSQRSTLMYAVAPVFGSTPRLVFFYGPIPAYRNDVPAAMRVLGSCNLYYLPYDGVVIAGDTMICNTWTPSAVDRAALQ